jgi:uncharacterized protein YceK
MAFPGFGARLGVIVVLVGCACVVAADDRATLMDLYDATNGTFWVHNAGWGTQVRRRLQRQFALLDQVLFRFCGLLAPCVSEFCFCG